jgi:hypothetical protein
MQSGRAPSPLWKVQPVWKLFAALRGSLGHRTSCEEVVGGLARGGCTLLAERLNISGGLDKVLCCCSPNIRGQQIPS